MDLTHLTTLTPVSFLWERLLQKIAARQAYNAGFKWLNEGDLDLFTLIKVKIDFSIIMFLHHLIEKKIRFRFKFD